MTLEPIDQEERSGPAAAKLASDLLRRGQTAARHGDRQRAQRLLRATLIADPANAEARLWLAAIAEDPRESVQLLNEVLAAEPGHVRAAAGLSWAWERLDAEAASRWATPAPLGMRLDPLPVDTSERRSSRPRRNQRRRPGHHPVPAPGRRAAS